MVGSLAVANLFPKLYVELFEHLKMVKKGERRASKGHLFFSVNGSTKMKKLFLKLPERTESSLSFKDFVREIWLAALCIFRKVRKRRQWKVLNGERELRRIGLEIERFERLRRMRDLKIEEILRWGLLHYSTFIIRYFKLENWKKLERITQKRHPT